MKRLSSTLLALALSACCAVAHGQALTPQEEANARFQAGVRYYDARDFESARLAFTQAYAVMPKPGILLNLGLSEVYSGHLVEGLDHLDTFLKDPSTPPEKKERAKKGYEEAYRKTGHLAVRAPRDAEVRVDGKPIASGAPVVHVLPGPHKVEARADDKTKAVDVDAPAGVERKIELALDDATAPAAPAAATAPPVASSHVEPPKEEPHTPSWDTGRIVGFAALAAGVGGLTAGVVLGSSSNSERDRADELRQQLPTSASCGSGAAPVVCTELSDARESQDRNATLSTVFFVSGGVLAAAGAVLMLWPRNRVHVAGSASAHDAGLLVSGKF